jgi:dephospho-CoA kinase
MQMPQVIDAIKRKHLGTSSFFEGAVFKRDKLAEIVFSDSEKLRQLNAIVHPAVKQHFLNNGF